MRVRLLRATRIKHEAGETVEVSSADAEFLLAVGSAEPVADPVAEPVAEPVKEDHEEIKRVERKKKK